MLGPEENLAWRTPLAPGYSSPVLGDDAVFLTGAQGTELYTYCVDRATGAVRWRVAGPEPLEDAPRGPNSPVSPTPATDGTNVYVFFPSFGLVSYDGGGDERWRLPLGPFVTPYGMGTSPVLAGDLLVLQCDQDTDSYLVAVERDSGAVRWKTARPGATHGFSTPVLYEPEEGPAELIVSGSYRVTGYDLASGEELWWVGGMAWQSKTLPVVGDGVLFVHSWMASPAEIGAPRLSAPWEETLADHDADGDGLLSKEEADALGLARVWFLYDLDQDGSMDAGEWGIALARSTAKSGLYAIRLGGRGDVTESHLLWRHGRSLPNIPSPVHYRGVLYVLKEGGILTALDPATGEVHRAGRVEGAQDPYFASPVAADGRLFLASHEGRLAVLEAGPEWEVTSVSELGEEIWATPALAGGQVFVRTQEALYCFERRSV